MTRFFINLTETKPVFKTDEAYHGFLLTITDEAGNVVELVLSLDKRDEFIKQLAGLGQFAKIL